jgi:hypothetical protein
VHAPKIWHWHGYKPADVECWLASIRGGTWPAQAWRSRAGCARGSCRFTPIKGSGCRLFARIEPKPCYLRTYTYLLEQHRSLLRASEALATRTTGRSAGRGALQYLSDGGNLRGSRDLGSSSVSMKV